MALTKQVGLPSPPDSSKLKQSYSTLLICTTLNIQFALYKHTWLSVIYLVGGFTATALKHFIYLQVKF